MLVYSNDHVVRWSTSAYISLHGITCVASLQQLRRVAPTTALMGSSNFGALLKQLRWFTPRNTFVPSSNSIGSLQQPRWFTPATSLVRSRACLRSCFTPATPAVNSITYICTLQQLLWFTTASSSAKPKTVMVDSCTCVAFTQLLKRLR